MKEPAYKEGFTIHNGRFLRVRLVLVADQTVEGDQVQSGDTNECVDDSGKGGAGSE